MHRTCFKGPKKSEATWPTPGSKLPLWLCPQLTRRRYATRLSNLRTFQKSVGVRLFLTEISTDKTNKKTRTWCWCYWMEKKKLQMVTFLTAMFLESIQLGASTVLVSPTKKWLTYSSIQNTQVTTYTAHNSQLTAPRHCKMAKVRKRDSPAGGAQMESACWSSWDMVNAWHDMVKLYAGRWKYLF